ncbi:hypothetical protein [Nonomuraea lactucae]|uniref:hypothetical protein n=1 Tax=Nonomuraea lactucae TaxID=2249762 RepID=UPI0013B4150A|nr:hypothetical protein [Nonomuraea lactucae]
MTSPMLGRTVLAIDELIQRPDIAEIVAELHDLMTKQGLGWLQDQHAAAAAQVHDRMDVVNELIGKEMRHLPASDHPDWIRLGLLTAFITWAAGKSGTCRHNPSATRPQPVAAAAWKPGLVVCNACVRMLTLPRNSPKDRTCDACGTITAGKAEGNGIWSVTVAHGAFIYMAGVCRDCKYWTE